MSSSDGFNRGIGGGAEREGVLEGLEKVGELYGSRLSRELNFLEQSPFA